ncbi:MAG TPA: acetate uptake transporter [Thermoplasmata archaeon]|nr:acetate uptake transporter [Thermoplasmata archaeon]
MPATATMETAHGMTEAPPRVEEKPEWWASPATLGLFGFGMTTILAGLFVGGWIGVGPVLSMALFYGGTAQFLAGIIAFRKGNMFAGSAFASYGMFWWAFNWFNVQYGAITNDYAVAAFQFVWFLVTLTFLLNAYKHGIGVFLVFLTLTIAFLLLTWLFYAAAGGHPLTTQEAQIIGGEIILTGFLAWLTGTADVTNWNYGRKILPL